MPQHTLRVGNVLLREIRHLQEDAVHHHLPRLWRRIGYVDDNHDIQIRR